MEEETKKGGSHPRIEEDGRRHGQAHDSLQSWARLTVERRRQLPTGSRHEAEEEAEFEEAFHRNRHGYRIKSTIEGSSRDEKRDWRGADTYSDVSIVGRLLNVFAFTCVQMSMQYPTP